MTRHRWESLSALNWKCIGEGCALHRQERPNEHEHHPGFTEYYVLEKGEKRFLPKGAKLPACPYTGSQS